MIGLQRRQGGCQGGDLTTRQGQLYIELMPGPVMIGVHEESQSILPNESHEASGILAKPVRLPTPTTAKPAAKTRSIYPGSGKIELLNATCHATIL